MPPPDERPEVKGLERHRAKQEAARVRRAEAAAAEAAAAEELLQVRSV